MTANTTRTVTARTTDTEHSTTVIEGKASPAGGGAEDPEPTVRVKVPDDASAEEVDAITAAVREHLVATGRLAEADEPPRWVTASRLQGVDPGARTLLDGADADPWVAASRVPQRW